MKIGVSTLFCLHKKFEEALLDITQTGTRFIEFVDSGFHILDRYKVDKLLEIKDSYGFSYSLHAPFSDMNIASVDPLINEAVLKRLENSIKWASELEVETFVFHPGSVTAMERFNPGVAWKNNLNSARKICETAEKYGVKALIENMPEPFPHLMKSVKEFSLFFQEIGADIKMVFDVAHSYLRGETQAFLENFRKNIGHIHISDNNGNEDNHFGIGKGKIEWNRVMKLIEKTGFNKWIVIESYDGIEESLSLIENVI